MRIASIISKVYQSLDEMIIRFQSATGMACPEGCSFCCLHWWVEATVVEVLPLGLEIYARGEQDTVLRAIDEKEAAGDMRCVLYSHDLPLKQSGACRYYEWRPLICRLFGFSAQRDKFGKIRLVPCRIVKDTDPFAVRRAEMALEGGLKTPVYQEAFMQIASLDPARGFRRIHINQALKEALEQLYWRTPGHRKWDRASNAT